MPLGKRTNFHPLLEMRTVASFFTLVFWFAFWFAFWLFCFFMCLSFFVFRIKFRFFLVKEIVTARVAFSWCVSSGKTVEDAKGTLGPERGERGLWQF